MQFPNLSPPPHLTRTHDKGYPTGPFRRNHSVVDESLGFFPPRTVHLEKGRLLCHSRFRRFVLVPTGQVPRRSPSHTDLVSLVLLSSSSVLVLLVLLSSSSFLVLLRSSNPTPSLTLELWGGFTLPFGNLPNFVSSPYQYGIFLVRPTTMTPSCFNLRCSGPSLPSAIRSHLYYYRIRSHHYSRLYDSSSTYNLYKTSILIILKDCPTHVSYFFPPFGSCWGSKNRLFESILTVNVLLD